jgi:hypothetical protein
MANASQRSARQKRLGKNVAADNKTTAAETPLAADAQRWADDLQAATDAVDGTTQTLNDGDEIDPAKFNAVYDERSYGEDPALLEAEESTPTPVATVADAVRRYGHLQPKVADALHAADLIVAAKKRDDMTKVERKAVDDARRMVGALALLGVVVERPTPARASSGGGVRSQFASIDAPATVALLAAERELVGVPRKKLTKDQLATVRAAYRVRQRFNLPSPFPTRSRGDVSKVWMPIEPAPAADCARCSERGKVKAPTMRVVNHTQHRFTDCCNKCGLDAVATERNDAGHAVTLLTIRDGQVIAPATA